MSLLLAEELSSVRDEFEDIFSREDDAALVSHPLNLFHLYRYDGPKDVP